MKRTSRTKKRANSRRETANARFLRSRNRSLRPPGPYRPYRPPRPTRDPGRRNFLIFVFGLLLVFSLGHIWKAHEVAQLCARLDSLRSYQRQLEQERLELQLKFDEMSSYSRIEPLARSRLGMHPSSHLPIVIPPVDNQSLALRRESTEPIP